MVCIPSSHVPCKEKQKRKKLYLYGRRKQLKVTAQKEIKKFFWECNIWPELGGHRSMSSPSLPGSVVVGRTIWTPKLAFTEASCVPHVNFPTITLDFFLSEKKLESLMGFPAECYVGSEQARNKSTDWWTTMRKLKARSPRCYYNNSVIKMISNDNEERHNLKTMKISL